MLFTCAEIGVRLLLVLRYGSAELQHGLIFTCAEISVHFTICAEISMGVLNCAYLSTSDFSCAEI